MSLLIKCINMPTSCANCWALDDYGDYPRCRITKEQRGYNFPIREKCMDNCPLVPVLPHGRLIDADAFWDRMKNTKSVLGFGTAKEYQIYDMGFLAGFRAAVKFALEMPTIIPADKGAGE